MKPAPRHTSQLDPVRKDRVHYIFHALAFFGLLVLSGALQRPIGGGSLQGSVTTTVIQETNFAIAFVAAFVYGCALIALVLQKGPIRVPQLMWPLIALNVWAIVSVFWSVQPSRTLVRAFGLSGCTVFAVYLLNRFTLRQIVGHLVFFSAFLVAITAVLAIGARAYAYHGSNEFFALHAGLLKGTFEHKNNLARILSLCLICLVILGPTFKRSRFGCYGMALVCVWLLVQTGSAKTLLTVPLAIICGLTLVTIRKPIFRWWLLFMALSLVATAQMLSATDQILAVVLDGLGRDPTLSARTMIWESAINSATRQFALIGGGYEAGWLGELAWDVRAAIGFDPSHAHNGFIMLYVELGLVGLGISTWWLILVLSRLMNTAPGPQKEIYWFSAAWLILFVGNNLSGSYFTLPGDLYWLMILLMPAFLGTITKANKAALEQKTGEKYEPNGDRVVI